MEFLGRLQAAFKNPTFITLSYFGCVKHGVESNRSRTDGAVREASRFVGWGEGVSGSDRRSAPRPEVRTDLYGANR